MGHRNKPSASALLSIAFFVANHYASSFKESG
jgi:hypothetical protein